jgi:hypothetical protein
VSILHPKIRVEGLVRVWQDARQFDSRVVVRPNGTRCETKTYNQAVPVLNVSYMLQVIAGLGM